MRDFSKVSPSVWRSRKFRSLPDMEARHVYLYLLTCPHANSAGCFDLHPMYACADLGIEQEAYGKSLESLSQAGLIEFDKDENTLLIVNWEEFNGPTNQKHALGLLSQLDQASSHALKTKAFHAFLAVIEAKGFNRDAAVRKAVELFLKAYPKPIATETRDRDKTETETRPDQTETETREEVSRTALRAVCAEGRDGLTPSEGFEVAPPPLRSHPPPSPALLATLAKQDSRRGIA